MPKTKKVLPAILPSAGKRDLAIFEFLGLYRSQLIDVYVLVS